jgi:hypothetical protein
MANIDWKELIKFYESFGDHKTWKELEWMKKFLLHLIESRNLQDLNYFTSHEILCVTIFKTYLEWRDKPFVTIDINWGADEQHKYKFNLVKRKEQNNMMRESTESVYCSFNKSLEIFDEIIGKLKEVSK